jgi:hypothetical protein
VSCPEHGDLEAWLVVTSAGQLVAAGRIVPSKRGEDAPRAASSWLNPRPSFLAVAPEDLRHQVRELAHETHRRAA